METRLCFPLLIPESQCYNHFSSKATAGQSWGAGSYVVLSDKIQPRKCQAIAPFIMWLYSMYSHQDGCDVTRQYKLMDWQGSMHSLIIRLRPCSCHMVVCEKFDLNYRIQICWDWAWAKVQTFSAFTHSFLLAQILFHCMWIRLGKIVFCWAL